MGKPSAPPAPDYAAAAQQTAAGNAQQARIAQFGSMTNQVTPYGTVNYTPSTVAYTDTNGNQISAADYNKLSTSARSSYQPLNQWTQTVTMSPAEQAMFNQNQAINQQLGNVAQSGVGYVQNAMSNPLQGQALATTPQSTADQMVSNVALPNYKQTLDNAGNIQSDIANAGGIQTNANLVNQLRNVGDIQSQIANAGDVTRNIDYSGDITRNFANPSDIATQTGAYQRAFGMSPQNARQIQVNSGANQQATGDVYNTAGQLQTSVSNPNLLVQDTTNALYNQQAQYLNPQFEQAQSNLENKLANQGITKGTEAYDRAMLNFNNQKQQAYESARNQAIAGGINAAQGMFGMNLQGNQFANQALGQQFGQNVTQAQLANTAAGQNNQLALANQAARNQALAQQYSQGLQGTQLQNQAAAQNNANALANAQFYNQALGQAYNQNLGAAGFQNQAQAQAYSQAANQAQLANQAQAQQFAQNQAAQQAQASAQNQAYNQALQSAQFQNQAGLQAAGFQNQAQAQAFAQNQALQQANNAAQQQQFTQNLQSADFQNQAAQGMFGAAMQNAALQNQAAQQAYQQALQSGQFQNQTAAQALAQAQALQQNPINMLNAVRTGQQMQVAQMPQVGMSSPAALNQVAGPDLLSAATAQGQYNQGLYNSQMASASNLMGSLIGAGGMLGGAAMLRPSDLRLKNNVIKIGVHKTLGIGIYVWDYIWGEKGFGVMAQELEKVMPKAVITMPDGFKAVNYGAI